MYSQTHIVFSEIRCI